LIGINLLREGLDIPECSLVAILDADKEGFLRSQTSLIQTIGRAARNLEGTVILYADRETDSISFAVRETNRRKMVQKEYNEKHGITPESVKKNIQSSLYAAEGFDYFEVKTAEAKSKLKVNEKDLPKEISRIEKLMKKAAKALEFEKATELRNQLTSLKKRQLEITDNSKPHS
jgi:excinuclease ABC subunit B